MFTVGSVFLRFSLSASSTWCTIASRSAGACAGCSTRTLPSLLYRLGC